MGLKNLLALLADRPLLTRKDLARHFSRDVRTIDRWHAEGTLPRPVYVHSPMWKPRDIERFEAKGKR